MFRIIRTLVLVMIAFVAGIFFERNNQRELCEESGGTWLRAGFCGAVN